MAVVYNLTRKNNDKYLMTTYIDGIYKDVLNIKNIVKMYNNEQCFYFNLLVN